MRKIYLLPVKIYLDGKKKRQIQNIPSPHSPKLYSTLSFPTPLSLPHPKQHREGWGIGAVTVS